MKQSSIVVYISQNDLWVCPEIFLETIDDKFIPEHNVLAATIAADNSRRDMVVTLVGAKRALPMTNEKLTLPSTTLRYLHWPYPVTIAPEKWWSSNLAMTVKCIRVKHLLISLAWDRFRRSYTQASHCILSSSGNGISHPMFPRLCCKIPLPTKINTTVDRTPLLVSGCSLHCNPELKISTVYTPLSNLSINGSPKVMSHSLKLSVHSSSCIILSTFLILQTNLCSLSLPASHIFLV